VCASGCDYATVEAALNSTMQATTINVEPGFYAQTNTSSVHNDVVLKYTFLPFPP
jgi:pectin methylesterase-like acyl-CoA thioesterase